MKIYEVQYGSVDVDAISLIGDNEDPANGFTTENGGFVALSKTGQQPTMVKFKNDNPELKTVYGIVLRADQLIDRIIDGEFCQMKFSAETIRQAALDWSRSTKTTLSNWNHEDGETNEIEFLGHEVWIVEDGANDKANAIGMSVEKGDWIVGQKLSDEDWDVYQKSGRIKGYSIESFLRFSNLKFKEVNNVLTDDSNKKIKKNSMTNLLNLFSSKQKPVSRKIVINLASVNVDGTEYLSDDDFAEKTLVYTIDENDTKVPVADATFEVDGYTIVTDADGMVSTRTEIVDDTNTTEENLTKVKQTLSGELGAYIELPVGVWTIDGNVYTVVEVTEGEGDMAWTYNSIETIVPVEVAPETEDVTTTEMKRIKEELKSIQEKFSKREVELGKLEANKQKVELKYSEMTNFQKLKYNRGLL